MVVSVPLRGCGFEIPKDAPLSTSLITVSVPLRGCGFEIINLSDALSVDTDKFPSPCGDVVLKFSFCF